MFAHGHREDARLYLTPDETLRQENRRRRGAFRAGGRSSFQSLCVQLARMGCVVWQWDMLSDSDSIQLSRQLVHGFAKQRPEMNTTENWGLYSPQAEAHLPEHHGPADARMRCAASISCSACPRWTRSASAVTGAQRRRHADDAPGRD